MTQSWWDESYPPDVLRPGGNGWAADQFVVVFVTDAPNQVANLFLSGCGAGNTMDWGDGTVEELSAGAASGTATHRTHTYDSPGTYRAVYTGTFTNIGGASAQTPMAMAPLVAVEHWGAQSGTIDAGGAFTSCFYNSARQNTVVEPPNSVTVTASMFSDVRYLHGDITKWRMGNVANLAGMFSYSWFNQDISGWNVSGAQVMVGMFSNARDFNRPIGQWDVSNVVTMDQMFAQAQAFNQDLSAWNVGKVTSRANFNSGANPTWTANAAWQPQWVT